MRPEDLSLLNSPNADFIAQLYTRYLDDPSLVDGAWRRFFASLNDGSASEERTDEQPLVYRRTKNKPLSILTDNASEPTSAILDSLRALWLIRTYRMRGHLLAKLDPLGLSEVIQYTEFDPASYGFADYDLGRSVFIDGMLGLQTATVNQIIERLHKIYCGSVGIEYMHIQDPAQRRWIRDRLETSQKAPPYDPVFKTHILQRLTAAESFEKFLQTKFPGTARFSLEGAEALIPAMEAILATSAFLGMQKTVIGMAHRGRLNVLANILNKSLAAIFAEFQGTPAYPDSVQGSGDLKYHLGTSTDREFGGKQVRLTLIPNPSHLEFVDPVVAGRVRAKQQQCAGDATLNDKARQQIMGLLIHGDAAFAGQGIAAETLMLSELRGYSTGGMVHIIINNQVGFTTSPRYARSGVYCTDVAKMIQAPVFHVNGNDVEAVIRVAHLAATFRQQFHRDVIIDLVCYRRHGHSENDEPSFTQPLMVAKIKGLPTARELYTQKLVAEDILKQNEAEKLNNDCLVELTKNFEEAADYKPNKADWLEGHWLSMANTEQRDEPTGVDVNTLREIGGHIAHKPEGFNIHPKIETILKGRRLMIENGEGIDWPTAEALAFGSLVLENHPLRISGQDCGRGTFAQRHAILYDQKNEQRYIPLNGIHSKQALFEAHDSPLSEAAVLGFEYGFSLAGPETLVCWEAQFGDFTNVAQVIIDQFIASGETKWLRLSGLTLLLPHGYEGQGPEHSSARLERFLEMCGRNNWQVAQCTTPANYFHILRRQVKRNYRKPLVLFTPKSLLFDTLCVSRLTDMRPGTSFQPVIGDSDALLTKDDKILRVIICSGKIYYALYKSRAAKKIDDVVLVRLEQFYPFPAKELGEILARYPNAEIVWCQEEPENMGAWHFLDRRIEAALAQIKHKTGRPSCVARPESPSPATGSLSKHLQQQQALVEKALHVTSAEIWSE